MDSSNMEDLRLPQTVVTRLIREAIPTGVNVSKEVKIAIARSAAIFVVHATSYANEFAVAHNRKNVTAADVFYAIKTLECEELEKPINEAMESFNVQREQRRQRKNNRVAERKSTAAAAAKTQSRLGSEASSSTNRDDHEPTASAAAAVQEESHDDEEED